MAFGLLALLMLIAEGCGIVHQHRLNNDAPQTPIPVCMQDCQQPAQSWDQENLKRSDHGCPTAIYVAPGGNLEQCDD